MKITNIIWNTDSATTDIKKLPTATSLIKGADFDEESEIADVLSDNYGVSVKSYDIVTPPKMFIGHSSEYDTFFDKPYEQAPVIIEADTEKEAKEKFLAFLNQSFDRYEYEITEIDDDYIEDDYCDYKVIRDVKGRYEEFNYE